MRKAMTRQAKPISDLPDEQALLKAVFASDVGVDNEPITTRDGGTIWFEVANIEPARQQSFDEVKAEVTAGWTADERAKALAAKADADRQEAHRRRNARRARRRNETQLAA